MGGFCRVLQGSIRLSKALLRVLRVSYRVLAGSLGGKEGSTTVYRREEDPVSPRALKHDSEMGFGYVFLIVCQGLRLRLWEVKQQQNG